MPHRLMRWDYPATAKESRRPVLPGPYESKQCKACALKDFEVE